MLSIIINAYACSPDMGSEPGMAWNWCVNLAKYCELYIITEGEFRDKIEAVVPTLPQGKDMHFYYNPVSDKVRRMCWNQGDWRFYWYYRKWQLKTLEIAKAIIAKHNIDVLHQLNMIGFREPGYLWKIEGIPFVWGPIGGMELVPTAYLHGAGWKTLLKNRLKNVINSSQMHHQPRVLKAIKRADMLVAATGEAYNILRNYHHKDNVVLINETGCYASVTPPILTIVKKETFDILWVGKFDFRKQLGLALEVMGQLKDFPKIHLHVLGTGSDEENVEYHAIAERLGIGGTVAFHGNVSHSEVLERMGNADLFLFTSISDETSTVILEALGCSLPVVCFDACGFGPIITQAVGRKVPLSDPKQSVADFKNAILELYSQPELLKELSDNCCGKCKTLTWEYEAEQMVEIYNKVVAASPCGSSHLRR